MALETMFSAFEREAMARNYGNAVVEQVVSGVVRDVFMEEYAYECGSKKGGCGDSTEGAIDKNAKVDPDVDEVNEAIDLENDILMTDLDHATENLLSIDALNIKDTRSIAQRAMEGLSDINSDDSIDDPELNKAINALPDTSPDEVASFFKDTEDIDSMECGRACESMSYTIDLIVPDTIFTNRRK